MSSKNYNQSLQDFNSCQHLLEYKAKHGLHGFRVLQKCLLTGPSGRARIKRVAKEIPSCAICAVPHGRLYACILCASIGCWKPPDPHASRHAQTHPGHELAVDVDRAELFCVVCHDQIYDPDFDRAVICAQSFLRCQSHGPEEDDRGDVNVHGNGIALLNGNDCATNRCTNGKEGDGKSCNNEIPFGDAKRQVKGGTEAGGVTSVSKKRDASGASIRSRSGKELTNGKRSSCTSAINLTSLMDGRIMVSQPESWKRKRGPEYRPWVATAGEKLALIQGSSPLAEGSGMPSGLRGLNNLGNTCFMNSVLQALLHTPPLRNYFLSDRHNRALCQKRTPHLCLGCDMDTIFSAAFSGDRTPYSPAEFLYSWWRHAANLAGYEQQDAHEFFISTVDGIHANSGTTSPRARSSQSGGRLENSRQEFSLQLGFNIHDRAFQRVPVSFTIAFTRSNVAFGLGKLPELLADFDGLIGEENPHEAVLRKLYLKKIKRIRKKQGGDDGDSDESEEEEDDDDDDDALEEDDEPEVCPHGVTEDVFNSLISLRTKRMEQYYGIKDNKALQEVITREKETLLKKKKIVDSALEAVEGEMDDFQMKKQDSLNKVDVCLTLQMHQIEYLHEGAVPENISGALVFSNTSLLQLKGRIEELAQEKIALRRLQKELWKQNQGLCRERKANEAKVAEWQMKVIDIQMLKFGQVIDLDALDCISVQPGTEDMKEKLRVQEEQNAADLAARNKKIHEATDELSRLIKENAACLNCIADIKEKQMTISKNMKGRASGTVLDPLLEKRKEEVEYSRLCRIVNGYACEIDDLRDKLRHLRSEKLKVYPYNTSNTIVHSKNQI